MAGYLTVVPIKVFLESEKKTATLRVTNNGEEKLPIQVRAVTWSQDEEGRDKFSPTEKIVFFPKIFSLEAGQKKIVRIGYQGKWPADEKTYRLFLEELPVSKPGEMAMKMVVKMGIPVFISPLKKVEKIEIEKVAIEEVRPAKGRGQKAEDRRNLVVRVRNKGNVHISVKKIQATGLDESGKEIFSKEVAGWYVLPGVSGPFAVGISPEDCQQSKVIKVRVETEASSLKAELKMDKTE